MGRLFWKFLFAFWLTLIAAGFGVGVVVWLHKPDESFGTLRHMGDPRAALMLRAAASTLRHGGLDGLKAFVEDQARRDPPPIYVVNARGEELLGRSPTPDDIEAARLLARSGAERAPAMEVELVAGQSVLLFVPTTAQRHPGPPPGVPPGLPPPPWVPIIAALIASLIFSASLAWYVVKPIRRLRQAFRAVAEGRLETRIQASMGGRRDELADLGQGFDAMTRQLERLIGAQRRLFHDVSHELRSPLARLHAAIGLVRQQPARLEETLDRLEREAGRLDELVGEVLTLARIESGMNGVEPEEFDISDLLEGIVDDARFEAESRDCRVEFQGIGPVRLRGRAEMLGRALENVIRNSVQHSPEGRTVTVTSRLDATGKSLKIAVSDQGGGVPEIDLAAIFEPFYRGRHASGRTGYGLGLAIAQRAVAAHGGVIRASNRSQGGLCVEIALPIAV
jgi:two-component system OmpR family sensor kinase